MRAKVEVEVDLVEVSLDKPEITPESPVPAIRYHLEQCQKKTGWITRRTRQPKSSS